MGTLSDMHRRGRIRRGKTNRDPLRKVVGYEGLDIPNDCWGREVLECGHKMFPRTDFIGPNRQRIGGRRRCNQCAPAESAATAKGEGR